MDAIERGPEPAWWAIMLKGLATLLLGVLLLASPAKTLLVLITFLGAYWVVRGVIGLFDAFAGRTEHRGTRAFAGIISILAGGFVLAYPAASTLIVPLTFVIIVGVVAVVSGVLYTWHGATYHSGATIVLGVLDLIFGLIVLASPYVAVVAAPYVLGGYAVIEGIVLAGVSIGMRGHQHSAHRVSPA